jgi:hypothetical protein
MSNKILIGQFAELVQNEMNYTRDPFDEENSLAILYNFQYIEEKQFAFSVFLIHYFIELKKLHRKFHILLLL